jgi:hypothetical protein
MSIAEHRFYNPFYILDCVPGSIGKYDLPDLASALAPRKLIIEEAVDCLGTKTYSVSIGKDLDIVRNAYSEMNAISSLKISEEKLHVNEIVEFLR